MTSNPEDVEHWSKVAEDWIAWARTPGHDPFWAYRSALLDFVGNGHGRALEVGCGEGRVSRVLKQCGYHVTALDPVQRFIDAAREEESADEYVTSPATDLPFDAASFDIVMAYNVLMDIEDLAEAMREIGRVLKQSGTLMVSIVHPFFDGGRFAGDDQDAPFVHEGEYFGRKYFSAEITQNGLTMHFSGWSQPLGNYVAAFENEGLAVTSLREPVPVDDGTWSGASRHRRVPLFLWMKAKRLAA